MSRRKEKIRKRVCKALRKAVSAQCDLFDAANEAEELLMDRKEDATLLDKVGLGYHRRIGEKIDKMIVYAALGLPGRDVTPEAISALYEEIQALLTKHRKRAARKK